MARNTLFLTLLALLAVAAPGARAQPAPAAPPAPGLEEPARPPLLTSPVKPSPPPPRGPEDSLQRGTPRGTVRGFLEATRAGDWEKAAEFLDLRRVSSARRAEAGPELARQLKTVLDRTLWVDLDDVSDDPEGMQDDGLPPRTDRLATLETPQGAVDLKLAQVARNDGEMIWKVASDTVRQVPALHEAFGLPSWTTLLPPILIETRILDFALWQWLAFAALVTMAVTAAWLFEWLLRRIVLLLSGRLRAEVARFLAFLSGPLRFGIGLLAFHALQTGLGASVRFTQTMATVVGVLSVVAITWLALRGVEAISERIVRRLTERGQLSATALVPVGRRMVRFVVLLVGLLFFLHSLGLNVTALVAGLGVGGLAVALAAQKTLENLFGGVTLIADAPVRVGDFCRFGDKVGTVEDIGLRSTRIRTLERTVVAVPNAEFSALHLENFGRRDRFLFRTQLGLRYETTSGQVRFVVAEVRRALLAHPKIDPEPARVRFVGFGESSLDVEIWTYIRTADINEFYAIREELLLTIMGVVEQAGSGFAFPSRTTYLAHDGGLDPERRRIAEEAAARWAKDAAERR